MATPLPIRRILGMAAVVVIVALSLDVRLIQILVADREALHRYFTRRPDRLWPEYPRFLDGVRERTQNGDSIALIVPTTDWENGYSYAYYRGSYLLAGREVLPISDSGGGRHPENVRRARYLAVWGRSFPPGPYTVVWRGHRGALLRM